MKKIQFIIFFIALLLSNSDSKTFAQEPQERSFMFSYGTDIKRGYYWRGMDMEHRGSIQPYFSTSWHKFTLGTWGAFRVTGEGTDEIDLYISKEIGPLTVTLIDYWSYSKDLPSNFFNLHPATTSHLVECIAVLSGGDKIPLNLLTGWLFYGSDPTKSLYFEIQYIQPLFKGEAMLYAGYQAKGSYYAQRNGFVNTGLLITYPLPLLKNYNLDIFADIMGNPRSKKLFFDFGVCFYI